MNLQVAIPVFDQMTALDGIGPSLPHIDVGSLDKASPEVIERIGEYASLRQ